MHSLLNHIKITNNYIFINKENYYYSYSKNNKNEVIKLVDTYTHTTYLKYFAHTKTYEMNEKL